MKNKTRPAKSLNSNKNKDNKLQLNEDLKMRPAKEVQNKRL